MPGPEERCPPPWGSFVTEASITDLAYISLVVVGGAGSRALHPPVCTSQAASSSWTRKARPFLAPQRERATPEMELLPHYRQRRCGWTVSADTCGELAVCQARSSGPRSSAPFNPCNSPFYRCGRRGLGRGREPHTVSQPIHERARV